jgi:short-subunit dehydrogenase
MKTALITGASSGIGREFAKLFAKDGYDLVLVARGREGLEHVKQLIEEHHHKVNVQIFDHDLSKIENIDSIYHALREQKRHIDVLVNNAGFGDFGNFYQTPWSREHQMMEVNMIAVVYLTKRFLPRMVSQGEGKILNVASTAAFQPGPKMAVYYATKTFVLNFSEAIADELRNTGVTVTTLCPGPTATHFQSVAGIHNTRLIRNKVLPSPADVALFGYKAMMKGKRVAIYGWLNKLFIFAERFLPRFAVIRFTRYLQENVKRPY